MVGEQHVDDYASAASDEIVFMTDLVCFPEVFRFVVPWAGCTC